MEESHGLSMFAPSLVVNHDNYDEASVPGLLLTYEFDRRLPLTQSILRTSPGNVVPIFRRLRS